MTNRIKNIMFALLSAAALTASSAMASETRVATVRVPFSFMAGAVEMPAGDYAISKSEDRVLFFRTAGKTVAILPVGSTLPGLNHSNAVRFEKVGGRTVLKEVVVDGGEGFLMSH